MAKNSNLSDAKRNKNDEFYTQYADIEAEMNAYYEYNNDVFRDKTILLPCDDPEWSNFTKYFAVNFERFGLKKLISTSYASDEKKHDTHGKVFILERDINNSGRIDHEDFEWSYLEGDGDFRSEEVTKLRDEADMIITNPPFSLFREFLAWIINANKAFAIIGNVNAITYKEVFPLIKNNKLWLGYSIHSGDRKFNVPDDYPLEASTCGIGDDGKKYIMVKGVRWFTNLDHGLRHEPLQLMTMKDNLRFNNKLRKKIEKDYGKLEYPKYDNYDAIEVPFTECIPADYNPCWFECEHANTCEWAKEKGLKNIKAACDGINNADRRCRRRGVIGVPITFLDKYCPEQFDIIGIDRYTVPKRYLVGGRVAINGKPCYARILIRAKCNGIMGVPITFLDKYNPEQFEILGCTANPESNSVEKSPRSEKALSLIKQGRLKGAKCVGGNSNIFIDKEDYVHVLYHRLLIHKRKEK